MATYINPNAIKDRSITSIKLADGLIVTDASIAALGYIKDISNLATKNAAIGSLILALDSTNYKITLSGTKVDGSAFTVQNVIDLPLESVVVDGSYNNTTKKVVLTLQNGSTVDFSVADLVAGLQSEITSSNKLSADLIQDGTTNKTVTATEKQTWNNAVQPADLSTVATTGAYSDLSGVPAPTTDASVAAWGYAKDASLLFKRAAGTNSVMVINNSNVDASITGTSAVALGMKCVIKGSYGCVAEGSENTIAANTNSCHAEGCYNTINYGGDYSHVEGYHNTTSGFASHVGGYYTKAQNHSEHASGKYNKSHYTSRGANLDPSPDASLNTLFSIGNGISENARKNAMEIMYNADFYITGIGGYDGSNFLNASTLQEVIGAMPAAVTESTVSGWGFTKNTGTLTSVKFNGADATVSDGIANITATIPAEVTESTVSGWGFTKNAAPGTLNTNNTTAQTVSASEALSGAIKLHKVAKTGTYSDLIGTPAEVTSSTVSGWGFTTNEGTITGITMNGNSKGTSGIVNLGTVITEHATHKLTATNNTASATTGEITFIESLTGTNTATSGDLTITATRKKITVPSAPGTLNTTATTAQSTSSNEALSGNITLHKVAKTGTYSDLIGAPAEVTSSTVSGWGFTKNTGTITGITMNGSSKGTSGVVDLGTVITSETSLSKGNTSGSGNAVTDITVNGHQITLTKGSTFLTSHQSIKTINGNTMTGSGNVSINELPTVTSSDNGKVLMVVNGAWTATTPVSIYSGSAAPNNSQGINGDLYLQI